MDGNALWSIVVIHNKQIWTNIFPYLTFTVCFYFLTQRSKKNNTVFLLFSLAFKAIFHLCLRQKRKHSAGNASPEAMKGSPKDREEFFFTGW